MNLDERISQLEKQMERLTTAVEYLSEDTKEIKQGFEDLQHYLRNGGLEARVRTIYHAEENRKKNLILFQSGLIATFISLLLGGFLTIFRGG
jgi:uncharacterized membrane protein YjjP (DUF1212 family)